MSEPINGVSRDQYGVWCQHGKHVMVADPYDQTDWPGVVPADPWPCDQCTYEEYRSGMDAAARAYE